MAPPSRDPALDQPTTQFEQAVAAFEVRLIVLRFARQDEDAPPGFLVPASPEDIRKIKKRWRLPGKYLEFQSRFSPVNVSVPVNNEQFTHEIQLFGAAELIAGQAGYSVNPDSGAPLRGWPQTHVVIGQAEGDPFALDLSRSDGEDAPVVVCQHGRGKWRFTDVAETFESFLEMLAAMGEEDELQQQIDQLSAAIQNLPDRSQLYVKRGQLLVAAEEYERALQDFDAAQRRGVQSSQVYRGRGDAAFGLQQMEDAVVQYTRSLELQTTYEGYFNRGRAFSELDRDEQAVADLTKATELWPEDGEAWHYRGRAYWSQHDNIRAEADFSHALALSSGDEEWLEDCYLARGGLRCNEGRTAEALHDLNQCLKLNPESDYALVFRGNAYWRQKEFGKAIADYERALQIDPDDDYSMSTLAYFLSTCESDAVRDGKRALQLARRAIKLSGDEEHLDALAAALAELGRYAEAVEAQQQAIRRCDDPTEREKLRRALAAFEAGEPFRDIES